ncbi:LAGLIDADG endonuclease (mitochondrion) [Cordyceps javanica]
MPQGMVTSLVDMWTIADLNHSFKQKGVKEQRVDGSSKSRNLDFVRCTLVAGKPVLGRRIHSISDNSIIKNTRFMHTTKDTLDPYFVTGLTEAEGSFTISFVKNDRYKMGYQIQGIFKITMHQKDKDLLYQVKDFFDAEGSVTKHGDTTLQYTVKSFKSLDKIIAHFDKYPLISQKYADYLLFKDAVSLIKIKEHLNRKGFIKVLCIRASMNLGLSDELQLAFPNIKPISRPSVLINNIDPNWIAGLASGDGCFHISIRNSSTTKLVAKHKSVVLKFHIVQHSRDIELMEKLISSLGCGKIELLLKQSAVYFVVVKFQDIFDKIIPLFDKYPIRGVKALDYADFKKVINIMLNKEHLTEQGLYKIQSIKSNMNLSRKIS